MKKIIVAIMISFISLTTLAQTKVDIFYVRDALISPCLEQRVGCSPTITIEDKTYMVEIINVAVLYHLHDLLNGDTEICSDVTGYIVKEKGHMPNPMAELEVFKVMAMVRAKSQCEK